MDSNVLPAHRNLGVVEAVNHQGKVTSDNQQNTSGKNDDLKIHDNSTIKGITINYTYSLSYDLVSNFDNTRYPKILNG